MKDNDPWEVGNKPGKLYFYCPGSLPWGSFKGAVQGGENQIEPWELPELRRRSWESRKIKEAEYHRRIKIQNKDSGGLQRVPPWILSFVLISVCRWGNYSRPGKEPPEKFGGLSAQLCPCYQPEWKMAGFTGHWIEYPEGSHHSNGK